MAFFDLDRAVQTLLIAGAIATATSCGGTVNIHGDSDGSVDSHVEVVDPLPDVLDTSPDHPDMGDPPPDVLDPDLLDAETHGVCPDPVDWGLEVVEVVGGFPGMTLRVDLSVPPEFIDLSEPEFSVEKKTIVDTREVAANSWEIDYLWEGPIEPWGDWDRLDVTWRVRCDDDAGGAERVLEISRIVCVMEGYMWLGWGEDPGECMVVDPAPESMGSGSGPDGPGPGSLLDRTALAAKIAATPVEGGLVGLHAIVRGEASDGAGCEWSASGGWLLDDGEDALWIPPAGSGVHTVQVVARRGSALAIDVFRVTVE